MLHTELLQQRSTFQFKVTFKEDSIKRQGETRQNVPHHESFQVVLELSLKARILCDPSEAQAHLRHT
jgi:hypothetical protein